VLWGIDHYDPAVQTYRANHDGVALERNIRNVDPAGGIELTASDDIPPDQTKRFDVEPGDINLIAGGPPCPTFSRVGRTKIGSVEGTTVEEDERHELYQDFLRFVNHYQPGAFIMENVQGITSSENAEGRIVSDVIVSEMEGLGYNVDVTVVDAANYGVPQRRKRAFFIGNRLNRDNPDLERWETHREPDTYDETELKRTDKAGPARSTVQSTIGNFAEGGIPDFDEIIPEQSMKSPWITVAQAILDLPPVSPGGPSPEDAKHAVPEEAKEYQLEPLTEYQKWARDIDESEEESLTNHRSRGHNMYDLSLYKLLGEGVGWDIGDVGQDLQPYRQDIFPDKYKKQHPRKPASTIVAHLEKDGHMFIHPREARSLTVREAARLQSFRDSFDFPIPLTKAFKIVGNAVPPRLAQVIGTGVLEEIFRVDDVSRE
jgi:DNA (cytosine-5)-methyltransferase 1